MYDMQNANAQMESAKYNAGAAALKGVNVATEQKPMMLEIVVRELNTLLAKASDINIRQINLNDRIFGCEPTPCESGKSEPPIPAGFIHEGGYKLQTLQVMLDRISVNLQKLERLA